MRIEIPEFCVVALVGASGSGKSTFAKTHFKPTEVLSSDFFRALISNDEKNQQVNSEAFDALYYIAHKRLDWGLLTVIDATNVQKHARAQALRLAKDHDCRAVAIALNVPEEICMEHNKKREHRIVEERVISRHVKQLAQSIDNLEKEGFRHVYILSGAEEIANAQIARVPAWNSKKNEAGPFDIIGDIHGCYDELCELLLKLNYEVDAENFTAVPPKGRKAAFLGDLCDRGPKNAEVLRLVMNMADSTDAICVLGNHDVKLLKKLNGRNVQLTNGLDRTIEQLDKQDAQFIERARIFLDGLVSHYIFDEGKLVLAHAGIKEEYQGRNSVKTREFCLYGETTGEIDEYGFPVRFPWANDYKGKALVVYGHIPCADVLWKNNTMCIDTGCVFGGKLTAYTYPERKVVQVKARQEYYPLLKPFAS